MRRAYRGSLAEAVRTPARELEGHFAFIAMHREQPGLLVGTRRRCPLVAGLGDGEKYLASSMNAFLGETRRVSSSKTARSRDHRRARPHPTAAGDECEREETESRGTTPAPTAPATRRTCSRRSTSSPRR